MGITAYTLKDVPRAQEHLLNAVKEAVMYSDLLVVVGVFGLVMDNVTLVDSVIGGSLWCECGVIGVNVV